MTSGNETWDSVNNVPMIEGLETMMIYFTFIKEMLLPKINPNLINYEDDDDWTSFINTHEKSMDDKK